MNKIVVVMVCAVFLTVGRVWAQEAKPVANPAAQSDNAENEAAVNDEGYGADDEEYYGSEEDTSNAAQPVPSNAVQALPSNAETK